jgi:transposase-like protein
MGFVSRIPEQGSAQTATLADAAVTRPDKCPECGSKAVGTLAKQITDATYWRCHQCGNVWNHKRDVARSRLRPWTR